MKKRIQKKPAEGKSRNQQQSTRASEQVAPAAAIPQNVKEQTAKKTFSGVQGASRRLAYEKVKDALAAWAMKIDCAVHLYIKVPGESITYAIPSLPSTKAARAAMRKRIASVGAETLRREFLSVGRAWKEMEGLDCSYGVTLSEWPPF
ncbi:MAG: hypothetical protein NTY53_23670 [Kiritimatiellaeota bacterium]|nr:hypothetical protein [Kiritimatiellota bacterium]